MKLLIYIAIIFLIYRALKSWILQGTSSEKTVHNRSAGEIDDIMVKDPYCEVYFPQREGIHLNIEGNDLYFCSTE